MPGNARFLKKGIRRKMTEDHVDKMVVTIFGMPALAKAGIPTFVALLDMERKKAIGLM